MESQELKAKSDVEARKGSTHRQWIAAIIANSSLLTYGLQAGWISPMTKVLQSESSPAGEPLSDYTMGLVGSLMPISAMLTVPIFAYIADRFGRKAGIMCITVPHSISWLLKLFCPSTTTLIIARICCGMGAGGCFNFIPMYTKEISQDNIRGLLGSLLIYFFNLGVFLMFVLGAYLDYYTLLYIVVPGPVLSCLCMMLCPESPGFLVKRGKFDEAVDVIASLRGLRPNEKSVQNEAEAMRNEEEHYKTLPALSMVSISQTFCGNFAVVTYGSLILTAVGSQLDAELLAVSFPGIMLVGSTVSILLVERIGRRVILSSSFAVSVVSQVCLATVLLLPKTKVILSSSFAVSVVSQVCLATVLLLQHQGCGAPGWFPLLAIVATMFVHAFGVLPVPYIFITETFNIQIRPKLLSMIVAQAWFLTFVQLAIFAPLTSAFGMYTTFYVFAAVNLCGVYVVLVLMPESRGKSVGEIETILRNK